MALDYYRPNLSGLSLCAEYLAQGLVSRGHSVTVLTHRHRPDLPLEEQHGGVRVIRAPVLAKIGKALLSPALAAAAWHEIPTADVVHLHAPMVSAIPLAVLARHRHVPLLVTYYCDLKAPPRILPRLVEIVARASQNFALDRADQIVTLTADYAAQTPALAQRAERVKAILPPIREPPQSRRSKSEAQARFGIYGNPVILFIGRFAEEKGLPHLLSALPAIRKRLSDVVLVLAGEKDNVPGETVGQRLAPLLSDPHCGITATGVVSTEEIADLFTLADVLVLPSTNSTEAFGLVQVEAMLHGVPVVASDLPGVRQPVRMTGMGEIAPVGDPAGLARQILRVLEEPERYRRPREEIRRIFSLDRTVAEYEDVYRAACAGKAQGL